MRVHWNFNYQNMTFDLSGEIFFDNKKPYMEAYSGQLSLGEQETLKELALTGVYNTQVVGMDGKHYSLYRCYFANYRESFADGELVVTVKVYFDLVIKQRNLDTTYCGCSFTFQNIEKLFPLNEFDINLCGEKVEKIEIDLMREAPVCASLCEGVSLRIESEYTGLHRGDQICSMNIGQTKRVYLTFSDAQKLDYILQLIKQLKEFFELCLLCELQLGDVRLGTGASRDRDKIVCSPLYVCDGAAFCEDALSFYGTSDNIISGIQGWIKNYQTLQLGMSIWQKQIYNTRIDQSDLILWNGQAIEAICEHYTPLFGKAKKHAESRAVQAGKKSAGSPNLVDYLHAINEYSQSGDSYTNHFMDAKKVRDKLTHNNPQKTVSQNQLKNTELLLAFYVQKALFSIIGLQGFKRAPLLFSNDIKLIDISSIQPRILN